MLKELFLAIVLGALLGFGITGGYLAINKKNSQNNNSDTIVTPTVKPDQEISTLENITTTKKEEGLTINSIDDMDIVSKEILEINGITNTPNNTIIAISGDQIINSTSDQEGKFSFQIKLISGLNNIKITAIDSNNNQFEKELNITYSTATI
jgi:hypothetical protein